jgi:hypothetical protein
MGDSLGTWEHQFLMGFTALGGPRKSHLITFHIQLTSAPKMDTVTFLDNIPVAKM